MTDDEIRGEEAAAPKSLVKRLMPLGIIAIALGVFFALGGPNYISLESLNLRQLPFAL